MKTKLRISKNGLSYLEYLLTDNIDTDVDYDIIEDNDIYDGWNAKQNTEIKIVKFEFFENKSFLDIRKMINVLYDYYVENLIDVDYNVDVRRNKKGWIFEIDYVNKNYIE
jgi:hypothetical protein